jgi:membrane protein required for colicin V production
MLLGVVDRVLGSLFGAIKGVIIVSLLFFVLITFLPAGGVQMMRNSVMAPHMNTIAVSFSRVVPEDTRRSLARRIEQVKADWEKARSSSGK